MKKTLFAALLATVSLGAFAQQDSDKVEYEMIPHFYIQAQGGAQYTLGEISFKDLISPNVQIAVGYNFGKVIGARFSVNGWQSKAGTCIEGFTTAFNDATYEGAEFKWKWYHISPSIDLTFNLSNLLAGYNPNRLVDVTAFIGGGANIHWKNDEAQTVSSAMNDIYGVGIDYYRGSNLNDSYLWDGTKCSAVGRAGLAVDFKITKNFSVGAEVNANLTSDKYNSKRAGNSDWYFNGLIGVKYAFGKIYNKNVIPAPKPQIIYRDRIVEKIVEKPVIEKVIQKDSLRMDVFFTIRSTSLVGSEAQKVNEVANYMKKYPETKVSLTGYADKGTGNPTINKKLSIKRAEVVKDLLVTKYGIAADRITTDSKGDTVQPYDVEVLNRVTICIAK